MNYALLTSIDSLISYLTTKGNFYSYKSYLNRSVTLARLGEKPKILSKKLSKAELQFFEAKLKSFKKKDIMKM